MDSTQGHFENLTCPELEKTVVDITLLVFREVEKDPSSEIAPRMIQDRDKVIAELLARATNEEITDAYLTIQKDLVHMKSVVDTLNESSIPVTKQQEVAVQIYGSDLAAIEIEIQYRKYYDNFSEFVRKVFPETVEKDIAPQKKRATNLYRRKKNNDTD